MNKLTEGKSRRAGEQRISNHEVWECSMLRGHLKYLDADLYAVAKRKGRKERDKSFAKGPALRISANLCVLCG